MVYQAYTCHVMYTLYVYTPDVSTDTLVGA